VETSTRYKEIANLIATIGLDTFSGTLDALIASCCRFDLSAVVAYPPEGNPVLLYNGLKGTGSARALDLYLRGTYLLDSVYQACVDRRAEGIYRLVDLAPDDFFISEYYNSHLVHPCISMSSGALAEEVVFLAHLNDGIIAGYSVMRENRNKPFSDSEFEAMRALSEIVCNAIGRNWTGLSISQPPEGLAVWSRRGELMEQGFESFVADALSPRERMIVRLVLKGHSSLSISSTLDIAEGTVKNHRKNIYAKLRISSQSELFSKFVEHICK
jgi:DNA-binding CsgD family transcriptional regulator